MEEKFGIENLKKVVKFGVSIRNWYKDANEDDKIELSEVFSLLPQLMVIPDLIQKKDDIINEAKDLSFGEIDELIADLEGVTKENVFKIIGDALTFVIATKNLVEDIIQK